MGFLKNLFKKKKSDSSEKLIEAFDTIKKEQDKQNVLILQNSKKIIEISEITEKQNTSILQNSKDIIVVRSAVNELEFEVKNILPSLEKIVESISRPPISPTNKCLVESKLLNGKSINAINLDAFSEKEKKILNVFFENKYMKLSYVDISNQLGKSPNTIKNQISKIRAKGELFNESTDDRNMKRFKIREDLIIGKSTD